MGDVHTYRCELTWRGSTGAGYDRYERRHRMRMPPAREELELSSDPAFRGDADRPNPEQLLLAAACSCQLLEFLALAARSRVDVLSYEDRAEAAMPEDAKPMRITEITLRPRIAVAPGSDLDRVRRLVERAHERCYVANTLNATMAVEPEISERSP